MPPFVGCIMMVLSFVSPIKAVGISLQGLRYLGGVVCHSLLGVASDSYVFFFLTPLVPSLLLQILMSDTVGFIQKLPTELVAAFRYG